MKKIYKILLAILSLSIGAFFIFSAYSKTVPVQYFEYTISSQLHVSRTLSVWAARFFIGLEAALGLLLLINVFGRSRWVIKACLVLLAVFSVHLTILWITMGNDVNCGCMGSLAPMSPAISLLKNLILFLLLLVLLRYAPVEKSNTQQLLAVVVTILIVALPFFLFPANEPVTLPLSTLYRPEQAELPKLDLRKGKHIVCFLSLTCSHCRDAATKIHQIKANNPAIPFYFFFPNEDNDTVKAWKLKDFMHSTEDSDIPYSFIPYKTFVDMVKAAGEDGVPTMLWMQDSTIIRKMEVPDIHQSEMEQWLSN
jgi:hypothetical protein